MDLGLTARTALVLGSTSGLGLATARALADEGASVIFSGRREDRARDEAARYSGALGVGVDVSDPESVRALLDRVAETHGHIDIVVLNSGGPPPGTAQALRGEEVRPALERLLLTQIEVVARTMPGMREAGWGRVVAIGSSGIQQPIPGLVQSNVARAGLASYLKTLAGEVADDGVTVNMVLPGRIDTDRVTQLDQAKANASGTDRETVRQRSEAGIPAGRYGTPEEFAAAAVFLCGTGASFISGAQLRVDGGMVGSF